MGITDTVKDAAKDFAIDIVAKQTQKLVGLILAKIFGDAHDDSDREAVARAILIAGAAEAERRAKNRIAADELPARLEDMARACGKVLSAFTPSGDVPDLDVNITLACSMSPASWGKLQTVIALDKSLDAFTTTIDPPLDGVPGCLGVWQGMPIMAGARDSNVPASLQRKIDFASETGDISS